MTDIRIIPDDAPNWVPPDLFKYRAVSENTRKIIADSALYFSSPAAFNDPFDFLPQISVAGTDQQRRDFYKRNITANMSVDDRAARRRALRTFSKMTTEELRKLMEDALSKNVGRVGVCSFSARNDHILMWSHYAANHTGICLRFSTAPPLSMFNLALRVKYSEVRPTLNRIREVSGDEMREALITKADVWRYEEEWRSVEAIRGPGVYSFDPRCLDGIILGARMSDADREMVLGWVQGRQIAVYEAQLSRDHFRLDIRNLRRATTTNQLFRFGAGT